MKRCGACAQEFQDRFNFCPVDGEALFSPGAVGVEYRPTIISENSLPRRLAFQINFLIERATLAWPRFRSNPGAFLREELREMSQRVRLTLARPYLRTGLLAAVTIILCIVFTITIFEKRAAHRAGADDRFDPEQLTLIDFQTQP